MALLCPGNLALICPPFVNVTAARAVRVLDVSFYGRLAYPEHRRELTERERRIVVLGGDDASPQFHRFHLREPFTHLRQLSHVRASWPTGRRIRLV